MRGVMLSLLSVSCLCLLMGCQKGHYTDDRKYIGDPERVKAASEGDHGDASRGNPRSK